MPYKNLVCKLHACKLTVICYTQHTDVSWEGRLLIMGIKANKALRTKEFVKTLSKGSLDIILSKFLADKADSSKFIDELLAGEIKELPEEKREILELANDIANEKGMPHLIKACKKYNVDFEYKDLAPNDLAVMLYSYDEKAFYFAYNLLNIDSVENYSDYKGVEKKNPNNKNLNFFQKELETYLKEQAKGKETFVDIYEYNEKTVYLINYGDYVKRYKVLEQGKIQHFDKRPVKQITVLYYPESSKLRIHAPTATIKNYVIELFSKHLFQDENFFMDKNKINFYDFKKVFDLDENNLQFDPSEIKSVKITELEAYENSEQSEKVKFHSPDVLKQLENRGESIESLEPFFVKIAFKLQGFGRGNKRTIELSAPNRSNINDSPKDELIRKYLIKWGIAKIA